LIGSITLGFHALWYRHPTADTDRKDDPMIHALEPVTTGHTLMHSMVKALGFNPETTTKLVLTLQVGSPAMVDVSTIMTDANGDRVEDLIRTFAFWAVESGLPR
jgi:hypothetical protein